MVLLFRKPLQWMPTSHAQNASCTWTWKQEDGKKNGESFLHCGSGEGFQWYHLQEDSSYLKPIISLNRPQAFMCVLGGGVSVHPKMNLCPWTVLRWLGVHRTSKPTASSHASRDLKAELLPRPSLSHTHFQIMKMNSSQSFCPVGDLWKRMLWTAHLQPSKNWMLKP